MKITNIINGKFPSVVRSVETGDGDLIVITKTVLKHLGVHVEGTELCRYGDDLTVENNHQYLMVWLKDYFRKYDGERDAMEQLIPRLKEHLACRERYFA